MSETNDLVKSFVIRVIKRVIPFFAICIPPAKYAATNQDGRIAQRSKIELKSRIGELEQKRTNRGSKTRG